MISWGTRLKRCAVATAICSHVALSRFKKNVALLALEQDLEDYHENIEESPLCSAMARSRFRGLASDIVHPETVATPEAATIEKWRKYFGFQDNYSDQVWLEAVRKADIEEQAQAYQRYQQNQALKMEREHQEYLERKAEAHSERVKIEAEDGMRKLRKYVLSVRAEKAERARQLAAKRKRELQEAILTRTIDNLAKYVEHFSLQNDHKFNFLDENKNVDRVRTMAGLMPEFKKILSDKDHIKSLDIDELTKQTSDAEKMCIHLLDEKLDAKNTSTFDKLDEHGLPIFEEYQAIAIELAHLRDIRKTYEDTAREHGFKLYKEIENGKFPKEFVDAYKRSKPIGANTGFTPLRHSTSVSGELIGFPCLFGVPVSQEHFPQVYQNPMLRRLLATTASRRLINTTVERDVRVYTQDDMQIIEITITITRWFQVTMQ